MSMIEHIAGPLENGVQKCSRCGEVLSDYSNSEMMMASSNPLGFQEGIQVFKERIRNLTVTTMMKPEAGYIMECISKVIGIDREGVRYDLGSVKTSQ